MNTPLPPIGELEKLPLYELVSLLDDLQSPEPISYLPATPLWSWIYLIAALFVLTLVFRFWKHLQRERYRKVACQVLERTAHVKGPDYAAKVSQILKWTALAAYPRNHVANLEGEDWLLFLDNTFGGSEFTEGPGQSLASSQYRRTADVNEAALGALAKKWITTHGRGVML